MRGIAFRLSVAQGTSGLFSGAYTPFFGAWLAWKGLGPVEIGILLSSAMLLRVVVAPVTGMIADARNDRALDDAFSLRGDDRGLWRAVRCLRARADIRRRHCGQCGERGDHAAA